jgi:hypothetical protein
VDQEGPRGQIAAAVVFPTFIPVQLEESAEGTLLRPDSAATVDLPATCDEVRGSESKGSPAFFLRPK